MRCVRAAAVRCTGNSCNRASGGQIIWVEAATVQCSKAQHSAVPTLALNEAGGGHQACPPLHPCLINRRPLSTAGGQLAHGVEADLVQRGRVLVLQQLQDTVFASGRGRQQARQSR